jgi:hypothetical protein
MVLKSGAESVASELLVDCIRRKGADAASQLILVDVECHEHWNLAHWELLREFGEILLIESGEQDIEAESAMLFCGLDLNTLHVELFYYKMRRNKFIIYFVSEFWLFIVNSSDLQKDFFRKAF